MSSSTRTLTKLEELEQELFDDKIQLLDKAMPVKAFSLVSKQTQVIAIDSSQIHSSAEKLCLLEHERMHIMNPHTMYNKYDSPHSIKRKESMVEREVIKRLIPFHNLKPLVRANKAPYEIADILGVTEAYVIKAMYYYLLNNDEARKEQQNWGGDDVSTQVKEW